MFIDDFVKTKQKPNVMHALWELDVSLRGHVDLHRALHVCGLWEMGPVRSITQIKQKLLLLLNERKQTDLTQQLNRA